MQVTNTYPQPLKYDKASDADLNKQTKQTNSDPRFADSSVATTNIPTQIEIQETQSYAPTSPVTLIAHVSCEVIT